MKRLSILIVLLLLFLPHGVIAQDDDTSPGWPIVERCLTPTVRPAGWTFDGTILLVGYAGIHGVNDAWDTPHVLAFLPECNVPGGAGLSPDGRWYAPLGGETLYADSYNFYNVQELQVYSTVNNGVIYRVPWENTYAENFGMHRMYWLDNQHLVYESSEGTPYEPGNILIVNPFDGSTSAWEGKVRDVLYVSLLGSYTGDLYRSAYWQQSPSPDFTRILITASRAIYDIWSGEMIVEINSAYEPYTLWTSDSSFFAVELDIEPGESQETRQMALFDREGDLVDIISTLAENQRIDQATSAWSPNNRFLAFQVTRPWGSAVVGLYIADLQERQIINTCSWIGEGVAFSPDSTQLAFLEPGHGTKYVMVLDLESWALHPIARHIVDSWHGSVIGWREDEDESSPADR